MFTLSFLIELDNGEIVSLHFTHSLATLTGESARETRRVLTSSRKRPRWSADRSCAGGRWCRAERWVGWSLIFDLWFDLWSFDILWILRVEYYVKWILPMCFTNIMKCDCRREKHCISNLDSWEIMKTVKISLASHCSLWRAQQSRPWWGTDRGRGRMRRIEGRHRSECDVRSNWTMNYLFIFLKTNAMNRIGNKCVSLSLYPLNQLQRTLWRSLMGLKILANLFCRKIIV